MKKLLTLFVLGFLLILALPTPALAHNPAGALAAAIGAGICIIAIIIAIAMSIIIALKVSSLGAALIMAIIHGMLFWYSSLFYFKYPTQFDPLISIFNVICLMNIILAVSKNSDLCQYRDVIIGILGLYIFIIIGFRLNIHYQDKCYSAISRGDTKYFSFCVKIFGVNKKIRYNYWKYNNMPLIKIAARDGQPEIVKLLISKGAKDIDADVISVLAATGDIEMVKQLLDKSCERTKNDKHNNSKCYAINISGIDISSAVRAKQYEMIDFLIAQGAKTKIGPYEKIDKEMIQFLLDRGGISKGTALWYAVQNGDIDWAKTLINAGADVNYKAGYLGPVIKLAAEKSPEIVRLLIDNGANVNGKDDDGNTALSVAAEYGYTESLSLLLKVGADVNAKDEYGYTVLMKAARKGYTEIIKLLIENGADVNAKQQVDETALMMAVYNKDPQSASMLIAAGADVNAENKYGITALFKAIKEGNTQNIKLLLDAGADPNNMNWYALLTENIRDEEVNTEIMFMFLKAGADVNAKDENSRTPLIEASYQGKVNIIRKLIKFGADVNAKDKDSNTALNYACKEGHLNAAKILIQAGADVNANVYEGFHSVETSLIRASRRSEKDFVQILIESGANVNAVDNYGRTALMETHNTEITKLLIAAGADINIKDNQGHTALFHTAEDAQFDRVKILLDAGANIDIKDNEGKTVLDEVRRRGYENIKNLLEYYKNKSLEELKRGTETKKSALQTKENISNDVETSSPIKTNNYSDNTFVSPLSLAIMQADKQKVSELIAQGADVNQKSDTGYTPLMYAVIYNHADIVKQLLEAKAEVNVAIPAGNTQLTLMQIARTNNNDEVIKLLKSAGAKE